MALPLNFLFVAALRNKNAKCKMQNDGIAKGDNLKLFAKQIPQLCIMNSALCIS